MGDWVKYHQDHWKCNKFEEVSKNDAFQKEERSRENAKHEQVRYEFYYERYLNHDKSEKSCRKFEKVLESKIELLHSVKSYPDSELRFLIEACQVVIKCRSFLKFTYAYGYYCIGK